MLHSESRWRDLGYKLKPGALAATWRETTNHRGKTVEYAVYDFDAVEPISGKDAAERRATYAFDYAMQRMGIAARQWWMKHQDAAEDDIFEAAFAHAQEAAHVDPFGNPIVHDNDVRQVLQEHFEYVAGQCRDEALGIFEDIDLQVKSVALVVPLCRRDTIPADWREFKSNAEWWKCGYTANNKHKFNAGILEYDGTVTALFSLDECVELHGDEAAARRKLYHLVVSKRVNHERTATPGQ